MSRTSKSLQVIVWSLLGVVLLLIAVLFARSQMTRSNWPQLSSAGLFTPTNRCAQVVTPKELQGKVWVAGVIFARCGGPCPKMTEEMARHQDAFSTSGPLRFVSGTTGPEF